MAVPTMASMAIQKAIRKPSENSPKKYQKIPSNCPKESQESKGHEADPALRLAPQSRLLHHLQPIEMACLMGKHGKMISKIHPNHSKSIVFGLNHPNLLHPAS